MLVLLVTLPLTTACCPIVTAPLALTAPATVLRFVSARLPAVAPSVPPNVTLPPESLTTCAVTLAFTTAW